MDPKYEKIMDMPHHVPEKHPRMSMHDRAAQFAPFAALTGYEEAVEEAERHTGRRPELSDSELEQLDERLAELLARSDEELSVEIKYFVPDTKKSGGACVTVTGRLRRINTVNRTIITEDGTVILTDDILGISFCEEG